MPFVHSLFREEVYVTEILCAGIRLVSSGSQMDAAETTVIVHKVHIVTMTWPCPSFVPSILTTV